MQNEEAEVLVKHSRELIEQSESDAIKQHGSIVVVAEEMLKSSNQNGKYIDKFLEEVASIHRSKDKLLLVCLGILCKVGFDGDKTSIMPQLNDDNYGFILSEYYPIKRTANSIRAAELFPDDPLEDSSKGTRQVNLEDDLEWLISITIGRLYKKSPLWRQRLMWQLVKEWNSRQFTSGIGQSVRERLGEDAALVLFREIADKIMSDPALLSKAVKDYYESNPFAK